MRNTLSNLCALQAIDDEARGFLKERDMLQEKLRRLKELLDLMTQGLDEKKGKLEEASRWYRQKDVELKADQEKVAKAKTKLQSVTKNKEYMAMQKEIEVLRKTNQTREEEILKLDEAMQEFKRNIAAEQEKIDQLRAEVAAEEQGSSQRIGELDQKIQAITARKDGITASIPRPLLSQYNRIYNARAGLVIVPVRNSACSGCNFRITPQQLQRITVGETMETCRSCNRFLYVTEETDGEAAPQGGGSQADAA